MRRLIMWNVITLDGFFEGPEPWSLDFHTTLWGPELEALSIEQLDGADGLVFGRRTWSGMADAWIGQDDEVGRRMNAVPMYVATREGIDASRWANTTALEGDPQQRSAPSRQAATETSMCSAAPISQRRCSPRASSTSCASGSHPS